MVEIHEGNKLSAEDTLHQALPDADLGQSKTIHKALHMLQVCKTLDKLKLYKMHFICYVCKSLDRVKLYTRHFICYMYVRPWT